MRCALTWGEMERQESPARKQGCDADIPCMRNGHDSASNLTGNSFSVVSTVGRSGSGCGAPIGCLGGGGGGGGGGRRGWHGTSILW